MVEVLFDDEIFSIQVDGGISRYFAELIVGLRIDPDFRVRLPFWLTCNRYLAELQPNSGRFLVARTSFPGRRSIIRRINRRSTALGLMYCKPDIVHATYYDDALLERLGSAKLVVTVHDMMPELMPEAVGGLDPDFSRRKVFLIEKATAVVAVSQNTALDIAKLTRRPLNTITVIHHGVSESMRWDREVVDVPALPDRFILCVGNRRAYKNFRGVAPALAELMRAEPDLALVCFGGGAFVPDEQVPFESVGVGSRLIAIGGDDRALASIYARAAALIYPSLYEGFGMPILEAMINRCPVILPRHSCFPEIADEAALYFDPEKSDSLVEATKAILHDTTLRRRLGDMGAQRASTFSWRSSVEKHAALYRSLAST